MPSTRAEGINNLSSHQMKREGEYEIALIELTPKDGFLLLLVDVFTHVVRETRRRLSQLIHAIAYKVQLLGSLLYRPAHACEYALLLSSGATTLVSGPCIEACLFLFCTHLLNHFLGHGTVRTPDYEASLATEEILH